MSGKYDYPTEIKYHIFEIVRRDIDENNDVLQIFKSTHKIFDKHKEAQEWIFKDGERHVKYVIMEVLIKN